MEVQNFVTLVEMTSLYSGDSFKQYEIMEYLYGSYSFGCSQLRSGSFEMRYSLIFVIMPPRKQRATKTKGTKPSGRARRRGQKRRVRQGILESNCHPHHKIHEITLECSMCGMCFCEDALAELSSSYNPNTGRSCPRCSGACQCSMCREKLPDRDDLIKRVEELTHERDTYIARIGELNGSYDVMKAYCVFLEQKLAKQKSTSRELYKKLQKTQMNYGMEIKLWQLKVKMWYKNFLCNLKFVEAMFSSVTNTIDIFLSCKQLYKS